MKRNLWSAVWTLCVLVAGVSLVQAAPLDDYNAALKSYEQKRWQTATLGFEQFIEQAPNHPKVPLAQLYLGQSLTHSQKYEEARSVFRKFLAAHPKHVDAPLAAYRIGESSYFLNDYKSASEELELFVKDYPNHDLAIWGWQYLGESRLQIGNAEGAVQAFEVVLKLKTDEAEQIEAKFYLARALEAMKQEDKAAALYQEVAASNHPRAAEALFGRATAEYQAEKFEAAARTFDDLLTRFPKSSLVADAQLNAGYCHYRLANYPEAQKRFEGAASSPTNGLNATFWIGMCHESQSDWEGAVKVFADLSPKVPQADSGSRAYELGAKTMYHWAEGESHLKRYDSAYEKYLSISEKWPNSKLADDSFYSAADVALRANKISEALQLVEQFPSKFDKSTLLALNEMLRGRILLSRGDAVVESDLPSAQADYQLASELFLNVVSTSPSARTVNQARILLGRAEKRLNHPQKVIDALTPLAEAIKKGEKGSEEYVDALPILGEALFNEGRSGEAETVLVDSLKSVVDSPERRSPILMKIAEVQATQNKWVEMDATLDDLDKADTSRELLAQSAFRISEQAVAKREWASAEKLLNRVIAIGDSGRYFVHALSQLGAVQVQQGQPALAAETYARMIEAAKGDKVVSSTAAYNRAVCLQKDAGTDETRQLAVAGEFATAAEQYAIPADKAIPDAIEQKAGVASVKCARSGAAIYAGLKKLDEADKLWQLAYSQLSKLQPADQETAPDLLNEWAAHQYNAGNTAAADEIYKKLFETYPESEHSTKAKFYVAQGYAAGGKADEARQLYQALHADTKTPADVRLDALQSWMSLESHVENWAESQRIADLIIQSYDKTPQALEARFRVGEAQLQQDQFKEGFATLDQLRTDPNLPNELWRPQLELLWAEAQLRLLEQDYTPLRTALEAFIASNPEPGLADQAHEILGRADYQEGKFDEARRHLKLVVDSKASEKTQLAAKAQFLIAECYLSQKKYESAVLEYEKVYTLYAFPEWRAPALRQIADCDITMKDWSHAKSSLETLIKEFPTSDQATEAATLLETVNKNLPATGTP